MACGWNRFIEKSGARSPVYMDKPNVAVGIAWYRADQYSLLRALSVDPDSMADSYEQWLAGVTRTMNDLHERGITVRRVDVDVKELAAWCQERGKCLDGAARSAYAAEKVRDCD